MKPYYEHAGVTLFLGDCLEVLAGLPSDSVDSCVTDPPYGLKFMGKAWDCNVPGSDVWSEVLRVLKPGGHLLCFAGTRTQHRMAVAIEDAGFEIRDLIAWVYGSGFPKSLDVSKAIDRAEDAKRWQGWGTALKPAMEPITVARKSLVGTVEQNVRVWGTGGINVDGCRVPSNGESLNGGRVSSRTEGWDRPWKRDADAVAAAHERGAMNVANAEALGRWPANLIHDGSEEVLEGFPDSKTPGTYETSHRDTTAYSGGWRPRKLRVCHAGEGSAARFFYCAKASRSDRGEANKHPTVKPTDLMRYLCRLVTPPGGVVLDPFMGSGSTGKAAVLEGFRFLGIERDEEYCAMARGRIESSFAARRLEQGVLPLGGAA